MILYRIAYERCEVCYVESDIIQFFKKMEFSSEICTLMTISACTKVTKELKSSALESFELFLHLPLQSYFPEHDELYEDIVVFERYIHEPVYLNAGGFFKIDSSLIFKLIGIITSYLIICLGFDTELIHHFTKQNSSTILMN
uniref:Uncharacterized protein LOC114329579 n=1 Tax=Diabrotica virgifera virgifera TaxID=50390 RepID=A0A6P7FFF5_DIAVI